MSSLGMEPVDGTPRVDQHVDAAGWLGIWLRIHRRLREGWTLGGGIEWVRREHLVVSAYANDTLGIATVDTLPQLRSLAYRLPVLGGIRIPLGWNGTELQASGGVALEWKTSETIASMLVQTAEDDRVLQAYQGRRVL